MAVLEVPLFSGFRADIESLEQVRGWGGMGWGWGLGLDGIGMEMGMGCGFLPGRGSLLGKSGGH